MTSTVALIDLKVTLKLKISEIMILKLIFNKNRIYFACTVIARMIKIFNIVERDLSNVKLFFCF